MLFQNCHGPKISEEHKPFFTQSANTRFHSANTVLLLCSILNLVEFWKMKAKWVWFVAGYFLFYLLVNFSFALPNEFDGHSIAVLLRNSSRGSWWRLSDFLLWLMVAFVPYSILLLFYVRNKIICLVILLTGIITVGFIRFYFERLIAGHPIPLDVYLFKNSYFLICFNLYGVVFFFIRYAQFKTLQAKELLIESRQAELSFLRSQVNPHFLFNSLNNIYSLVYDKSEHSLPAIAGLSDILRYMLYDATHHISLEKEITYIKKYIGLQNLRYEHPVKVELQTSGPIEEVSFPPLLFLPFVENAFKHGDFSNTDQKLELDITTTHERTIFHIRNKKGEYSKDIAPGIGIQNVRRRLELLYAGKHSLTIVDKDGYFDVRLMILHEK